MAILMLDGMCLMPRRRPWWQTRVTPWVLCPSCDDFACTIHQEHVASCQCPPIEAWQECGLSPYEEMSLAQAMQVIVSGQGWDDVDNSDESVH